MSRVHLALNVADLGARGVATLDETDTTCCYALEDKVWAHDPAGAPWEVYVIKDDDPADARPATASLVMIGDNAGACETTTCCAPAGSSA